MSVKDVQTKKLHWLSFVLIIMQHMIGHMASSNVHMASSNAHMASYEIT
jgi:hypothetical protein